MTVSPFHAYYKSRELAGLSHGKDRLLAAYASSDMEVFPYQVAAALFALRSPYLRGAVLCDEGSLGKTFEAMLVITQNWYEGCDKILVNQQLYLVLETKGSTSLLDLRLKESLKIHCGKEHFLALATGVGLEKAVDWQNAKLKMK